MNKRQGLLAVGAFALSCSLIGGSALAATKVVVWHSLSAGKTKIFDEIVKEFEASHPDIDVESTRTGGYNDTFDKAQVAWAAGAGPNVVMLEQERVAALADSGALLPLEPFVHGPTGIDLGDFYPPLLDFVTFSGQLFGLPYNTSTLLNYYNRDMFQQAGLTTAAPKTWGEFKTDSIKLSRDTTSDGAPDTYGMDLYGAGWQFENWIGQNGGQVVSVDGAKFVFNSDAGVGAWEFLQDLIYKRHVGVALSQSKGYQLFWAGKLAMAARSTASVASNTEQAMGKFNLGIAAMPCNARCYVSIGGAGFSMMKTGTPQEQAAAWTFLKYITATDPLAKFASQSGYMAARRSSVQSSAMQSAISANPFLMVTYDQLAFTHPRPKLAIGDRYDDETNNVRKAVVIEGKNPKAVLDQSVQVLQPLLDQYLAEKKTK